MTTLIEAVFPVDVAYGSSFGPGFDPRIVRMDSGKEVRNLDQSQPIHEYNAANGIKALSQLYAVIQFYMALGGATTGFLWKDWSDFKSCGPHLSIAITDAPLTLISGSTYQLYKRYTATKLDASTFTRDRKIVKPKSGTIRVANGSAVEQDSSKWTVDYTTGILTKGGTFTGTPTTWGGEFYVPVRFDTKRLQLSYDDFEAGTLEVPLISLVL